MCTAISNSSAPIPADGSVDRMVIGWIDALVEHAEDDVDHHQRGRDQEQSARQGRLKAWALPWKVVASEAGFPLCCSTCWMAATASPSATPGFRLNEIVTDGKHALMIDRRSAQP